MHVRRAWVGTRTPDYRGCHPVRVVADGPYLSVLNTLRSPGERACGPAVCQSPKQIPRSRAVATVSLASDTTFMRPTAASSGW